MKRIRLLALGICLSLGSFASADLQMAPLFQDHMVLQRDMPVPVWGWGEPGETVTVEFAGQKKTAIVDSSKHWDVILDPMPASFEPRILTVSLNHQSAIGNRQFTDVLVGEVWICSGQSNMELNLNWGRKVQALAPTSKNIRSFTVKRTVAFTEQDTCEGAWVDHHPDSAVAFGFAYFLEQAAKVPVGIILTCWGSSSIEAWMPRDMTTTVPHFKTTMEEFDADTATRDQIQAVLDGPKPWKRRDDVFLRRQPNILYNAMMKPLAPYACRGMVWYQGERNTKAMAPMSGKDWIGRNSGMLLYGTVLKQWMQRYRQEWNRDDFQFLVVMLPGYGIVLDEKNAVRPENPAALSWAWLRESQLQALELPHTAVANTIDLGALKSMHPTDKLPVVQRLALLATRDTLGQDIEAQGPVMKNVEGRGNTLVVHFDHADGLKTNDGEAPSAFWIADDSKQWVRAEAVLEGQTVVLRSPELKKPLYVRYAFAGMPKVNLVNGVDLPAYPFRNDVFEPLHSQRD